MSGDQIAKFWTIVSPATWPELPRSMSFSTLIELEACPRRWALKRADYVGVLDTRGYPDPPSLPTIEGTVVHLSLQIVASALVESGCPSLSHETAIATLRRLGGFTVVVQSSLERALKSYDRNPRAVPILDRVRERLNDRVPELRAKVQKQVARVQPVSRAGVGTSAVSRSLGRSRRRLLRGSYSEVRLQAPEIGWHGIADLVTISDRGCEIRDFKTGGSTEDHEMQLRIYALLWARDGELNPAAQSATRLVVSYDDVDMEVSAPDEKQHRHLQEDLARRTERAVADLGSQPPKARPSSDNCARCPVRQLCGEYWKWCGREDSMYQSASAEFGDAQVRLTGRHGPRSWDGVVESGHGLGIGRAILLRTRDTPFDLHAGQRLRLLNVHRSVADDELSRPRGSDPTVVVTMSTSSETYLVP